jgi:hypothetical protein
VNTHHLTAPTTSTSTSRPRAMPVHFLGRPAHRYVERYRRPTPLALAA